MTKELDCLENNYLSIEYYLLTMYEVLTSYDFGKWWPAYWYGTLIGELR